MVGVTELTNWGVDLIDVRKTYGSYLRESLPPAPLKKGPWADMTRFLKEFYA